ncbi:MAG TPA: Gfo/Idh/MocA family oxidoreductase [Candidatus Acidoferrales bacterium]|nr:Gfo/Idh/MocA family oxidoreductase [Candidatus Acidoferrales bacterium]
MIRYGIAGFGLHAVKRLMPGFAGAQNSQAVALSRRNFAQAQSDAARYAIDYAFATTRELCECPEVDAVFVTSPNAIHLADVLTCIEHGKHVLCEKPMAMNAAEAEQMVTAANQRGVVLGIAQCFRFCKTLHCIRESLHRGDIGRPIAIRADFSFLSTSSVRRWLHDSTLAGGGPIADVGVHCVDAMRFILGDEVLSCSATVATDEHSGSVEAAATLSLRFSKGTLGSSFVSFRAPYHTVIEIVGTDGHIAAQNGLTVDYPVMIEFRTSDGVRREEMSNADAYARQVDAFSAAIESGAPFPATGEDGLRNQRILDALYCSARTRKEVPISRI